VVVAVDGRRDAVVEGVVVERGGEVVDLDRTRRGEGGEWGEGG